MPLIKHCFLTLIVLCLSFPSHAQKRIKETSFSYLENDTQYWLKSPLKQKEGFYLNGYSPLQFDSRYYNFIQKNILKKHSSIFVVYQSKEKKPLDIIQIIDEENSIHLSTDHIKYRDTVKYNRGNIGSGIILNYNLAHPSQKTGTNYFVLNNRLGEQTAVYEVLYFPKYLSDVYKSKITTYLALKYGVTLDKTANYINSKGDLIWNYNANKRYNTKIFGLGRNDYFSINQTASRHSESALLTVSLMNADSLGFRQNDEYILLAENGESLKFEKDANLKGATILSKKWIIQSHIKQDYTYRLNIDFSDNKEIQQDSLSDYYLLLHTTEEGYRNSNEVTKIKGTWKNKKVMFDHIVLKSDQKQTYFSVIKQASLKVETSIVDNCFNTPQLKLHFINGTAPFQIRYKNTEGKFNTVFSDEKEYVISDALLKEASVSITDAQNTVCIPDIMYSDDRITSAQISLAREWFIDDSGTAILFPQIDGNKQHIKKYQWYYNNKQIADTENIMISQTGKYTLLLTNNDGCEYEMTAYVYDKKLLDDKEDEWIIYPNPSKSGEEFFINFNLSEEKHVAIYMYTVNSRLVMQTDLGNIQKYHLPYVLYQQGSYVVIAMINGKAQIKKIIIK